MESIYTLVRKAHDNYISGNTQLSKHVSHSLYETIERIDAYLNSKHTSGEYDSLGREKPFFNIGVAASNIWYRATDIDRKDINIKPTKMSDYLGTLLLKVHLYDWMRRENFGVYLNKWGKTLAEYGSAVTKIVKNGDKLEITVVPFNRLIISAVDFYSEPVIERLFVTPAQLRRNKAYDAKAVDALIETATTRKTMGGQNMDTNSAFIELYEVHGELPLSFITGKDKDDDTFVQQMHVICYLPTNQRGEYDDFCLYSGREEKNPYFLTSLLERESRTLGIGAIEYLFDAQWMVNHSMKATKDQLDLASKLIFQSSDPAFAGLNVLEGIETGDILTYSANQPLTQLQNNSHDITSLQNYGQQWMNQAKEITSTPDAISGNTMPSGTAYRQVAVLNQEAHSLFEIMIESKALALEEMLRETILPHIIKTQMNNTKEIVATLDALDVKKVDNLYISSEVTRIKNNLAKETILNGQIAEGIDENALKADIQGKLAMQGNERYFVPSDMKDMTWKQAFKDLEYNVEVEISGESSNKEAMLSTLTTVLQTVATNPAVLQDPNMKMLFGKILESTGTVSAVEIATPETPAQPTNNSKQIMQVPNGGQ